jgi:hypothetical protein
MHAVFLVIVPVVEFLPDDFVGRKIMSRDFGCSDYLV